MVQELKQSTAVVVHIGSFVDVGDGFTPEVAVTLSGADEAEVLKHAATTTTSISGLTWTAVASCDGWYRLSLGTGETDTLGMLEVIVQDDSVCLPVSVRFEVVTANYWDSKYSTDVRQVDVTQIGGVTQSAADLKDFADDGYDPATNKVQGVVLVDTTTTNTDVRGTDSAALASVCTEGRLAELDAANLPTDVAAVKADTAAILTDTADMQPKLGTPAADLAADVAAVKVDTAAVLVDTADMQPKLGTPAADLAADVAAVKVDTAAILVDTGTTLDTKLNDVQGATFSSATDSLEAIRDRGDAAWITGAGGSDPFVLQNTTIATLATQVSFTLTAGSADDDAYNGMLAIVEDASTATQKAIGVVSDYTGSSKTITLREDPGIFTMAIGDTIDIVAISPDILNIFADTADMQPKLGSPASDVSADIAAVKVDTAAVLVDTGTTLPATLGTPAADVSADIAAVKVDTAAVLVDTGTTLPATLGTPAADVSADIAAVKVDTAATLVDTGTTLDTKINDIQGATFATGTDSLEAIRDRGDAAWTTGAGGSNPFVLQNTTIATLATQVSFTLTAGSADDNAYLNMLVVVEDSATATQKALGIVSAYTGATKTITLREDPGVFTMAVGDTIDVLAISPDILNILADTADMQPKLGAPAADLAADVAAVKVDTAAILVDTADMQPKLGSPAADVSADIAAVKVDTAAVLVDTGTTLPATLGTPAADVSADIAAVKVDTAAVLVDTSTTLDTKINDIQGATFSAGTDSLEAIRDRGDAAWTTGAGGSNPFVLQNTTIATLATQVSFTLTAGSADDGAYVGMLAIVEDASTATQKAIGVVSAYTGSTKTITLREDPGIFTMAVGDTVDIGAISPDMLSILADTADMQPKLGSPAADVSADIAAVKVDTAAVLVDTADMQPKLGSPAADVSADIAAVKVDTAAVLVDTADMQPKLGAPAADVSADIAAVKVDTAATLVDTGTTIPASIAALPTANENAAAIGPQKNQAFSDLAFLMVLDSDGQTPATGLTVTGQRSIDGGGFASVSGTIAEVGSGIYQFDALAADMNGDVITFRFSEGTARDTFITIKTTP